MVDVESMELLFDSLRRASVAVYVMDSLHTCLCLVFIMKVIRPLLCIACGHIYDILLYL